VGDGVGVGGGGGEGEEERPLRAAESNGLESEQKLNILYENN